MDFFDIKERSTKNGTIEVYPDFKVCRTKDLMVRGKAFYAIWDEEKNLWSTDEYDVQRLVDAELLAYRDKLAEKTKDAVHVKLMSEFSTSSWVQFRKYLAHISDIAHPLDENLTFANSEVKKKDYVSKRLPYPLEEGPHEAWDELTSTLYAPEERAKIEWAIGAVVAGEARHIQKFLVLYGDPGAGKGTILNVIEKLFAGYFTTFEARALTSASNTFSTEVFRSNPLVAVDPDGDLSRIEDNTKLNSIVSHEQMTMNEKFKPAYTARANAFLFIATNKPVRISDGKAGIIRRLIDVKTSGQTIPIRKYHALMAQIEFELGGIAAHCLKVYREMGKNYYATYRPLEMMFHTDVFFNFVEWNFHLFKEQNGVTLKQAYEMYKDYCEEALVEHRLPRHKFREELKNYFEIFHDVTRVDGTQVRSYYAGFLAGKFVNGSPVVEPTESPNWLSLDETASLFDEHAASYPAQYSSESGTPLVKWIHNTSKLSDLDTAQEHYVKMPENEIVIDFDLKDEHGNKSAEKNFEAASHFPPTYAEYSKSGAGLHLHYVFDGDTSVLSSIYDVGIEVKVFRGDASLRRKLSKCNHIPIATINSGLPLKGEKVINFESVKSEKGLRDLIMRNLRKEIHPGTKPSMDFIYKILEDAYRDGLKFDISDLRPRILAFAANSTHQADYCLKLVTKMHFASEEPSLPSHDYDRDELVFFDVEVFPNLFLVSWKFQGTNNKPIHMINPSPADIERLMRMKLVGFNCRRYDNHILYARYLGKSNEELYTISQRIIGESRNALLGEAYNISYTDVYDFSSVKQSLKKFELELGIHHQELGFPWDQPVPEDKWLLVADYCGNDVIATEAVFNARKDDFVARQILADLSGLTVNDTTQMHTAKIIFGDDPKPQEKFIYTDLSELFPGYKFEDGKSTYRGEEVGEGGYVYAEPGSYENVALLDVASMHPTSIETLNLFGPYTSKFSELKAARIAIKHKEFDRAKTMLGGILSKYLTSPEQSDSLAYALKIVINIVYGLTSAKFDNKFRDRRNIDNIVAKRGALFMIELKHMVQERGFTVAHIKTDSIKIPNATPEIIEAVMLLGQYYGYTFEHEATYDRFCLVNDAVYIARYKDGKKAGQWTATGAQFAHPYVFKTLFSREPIEFADYCEAKTVTSALYLDMNEGMPEGEHNYRFVGKAGLFCPVKPGCGGGILLREKDGKFYAATGSKGYRWMEAEVLRNLGREDNVDPSYAINLVDEARADISKFVDFEWFVS